MLFRADKFPFFQSDLDGPEGLGVSTCPSGSVLTSSGCQVLQAGQKCWSAPAGYQANGCVICGSGQVPAWDFGSVCKTPGDRIQVAGYMGAACIVQADGKCRMDCPSGTSYTQNGKCEVIPAGSTCWQNPHGPQCNVCANGTYPIWDLPTVPCGKQGDQFTSLGQTCTVQADGSCPTSCPSGQVYTANRGCSALAPGEKCWYTTGKNGCVACPSGQVGVWFGSIAGCHAPGEKVSIPGYVPDCWVQPDGSCLQVGQQTKDANGHPCAIQLDGSCGPWSVAASDSLCELQDNGVCVVQNPFSSDICDPGTPLRLAMNVSGNNPSTWNCGTAPPPHQVNIIGQSTWGDACPRVDWPSYGDAAADTSYLHMNPSPGYYACHVNNSFPRMCDGYNTYAKMPFPDGAVFFKTSLGWPVILVPVNSAIQAWANQQVGIYQKGMTGGYLEDKYKQWYTGALNGTYKLGSFFCRAPEPYNVFKATKEPGSGYPRLASPKVISGNGDLIYNQWDAYYGVKTGPYLYLVNEPQFIADFDVIPWVNPFNTLSALFQSALEFVISELKGIICSSIGSAASVAAGVYLGKSAQSATTAAALQKGFCSLVGVGPTGVTCPSGQTIQPNGTCAPVVDNSWSYLAIGGALAVIGFLAWSAFGGKEEEKVNP